MGWESDVFAVLDDLEQQAVALYDAERLPEIADRSRAEYQQVGLTSRLMASLGTGVALTVQGVGTVVGHLDRVAAEWCVLSGPAQDWVVRVAALVALDGASARAVPEIAWPVTSRLGLGSALRRLGEAGERCVVHRLDGAQHDGVVRRVGRDFVELDGGADTGHRVTLLPFTALAAVQSLD